MPLAFLSHPAEQRAHLAAPRHHGELVHSSNHHRWRVVVDLLVHRKHRDAGIRRTARPAARERTTTLLVTAVSDRSTALLIDHDVFPGVDAGATPRATGELKRRRTSCFVLSRITQGLNSVMAFLGRDRKSTRLNSSH